MRRRLASLVAASVLAALAGCSSAKLADLDVEQPDLDQKRESLVKLGRKAHVDPELRAPLAEKARRLVEDDATGAAVRVVALRVLARLAEDGQTPREIAELLGRRAHADVEKDFWCRIEAIMDLCELATWKADAQVREAGRPVAAEACSAAIRPDEPDRDVRIHASSQLALLSRDLPPGERPEKALPELVRALSDETPDVRWHATHALVAIAGGDHGPSKEDWQRWLGNRTPPEPAGK